MQKDEVLYDEYINNNRTKMKFICNKHKELGFQYATLNACRKNKHICRECIRLNSIGKKHNVPLRIDKHYDEMFDTYEEKLKQLPDGNEYELKDIYIQNKRTMLNLLHLKCGCQYNVEQNKFLKYKNRCTNAKCQYERRSKQKLKKIEDLKSEIYNLVEDEYELLGNYTGTHNNIVFYHKLCGNTFQMSPHNFLSGQRCTHCTRQPSKGEQQIIDVLNKYEIKYCFQKSFDDLYSVRKYPLAYDFYLPDYNMLIEYQGEYHDGSVLYVSQERLDRGEQSDNQKKEYAKEHSIELLEIWYWDFDNIEKILNEKLSLM